MKIVRNGIEIELTWAEMREIYEFMKRDYIKDDIVFKLEETGIELDDDEIENIVEIVESGLSHNDSYWESYWLTIEYALNETKMKTITKSMIRNGYKNGIVFLISNPNDGCIAAQIGDNWFYFAGSENENIQLRSIRKSTHLRR